MRVVYRMRGLMGDATEDIIETLDSGSSENVNEEEIYHMADTMSQCGGLEAALTRSVCAYMRVFMRACVRVFMRACVHTFVRLWWVVIVSRLHNRTATHAVKEEAHLTQYHRQVSSSLCAGCPMCRM